MPFKTALISLLAILGVGGGVYLGAPIDNTPEHLRLKADKSDIIGNRVVQTIDGKKDIIKYAYKSGVRINDKKDEIVSKRTKYSRTFDNQDGTFTLEVISGSPQYYKDENDEWWQVEYATTTQEEFTKQTHSTRFTKKALAQTTDTFYSNSTAEDGYILNNNQTDWSTAHDATSGTGANSTNPDFEILVQCNASNQVTIRRAITLFDTSSLPLGASITGATYSVYVYDGGSNGDNDGEDYYAVVASTPASDTSFVVGDFDEFGSTELSSQIDDGDISVGAYNDFTLNASGISAINKTGVTRFGLREGHDILDSTILCDSTNNVNSIFVLSNEESGESQAPKLEVTYTQQPSTGQPIIFH